MDTDPGFPQHVSGGRDRVSKNIHASGHADTSAEDWGTLVPLFGDAPIGIHPTAINLMRSACHADKHHFTAVKEGASGRMRLVVGDDHLDVVHPEDIPMDLRRPDAQEAFADWARSGVQDQMDYLDGITLDIATLAVVMFHRRTSGCDIDQRFPLLVDDCMDWRGVDPRKRSPQLRNEIHSRIRVLCRARICTRGHLYLPDPNTGRRRREPVPTEGPYLVEAGEFFRGGTSRPAEGKGPDGYILSLGEWARNPARLSIMLGPYFRRLAQYDLRRERWERQIGWYVVTQLQNQSPYMTLELVDKEWLIRPQQPLTLVSILNGSYMPWERMKRNEAGAIIRQVLSALETLKRDGLIGAYTCLDGAPDGSDLPERGRLETMLPGRYLIEPGFLMRPHILKKHKAKLQAEEAAEAKRKS